MKSHNIFKATYSLSLSLVLITGCGGSGGSSSAPGNMVDLNSLNDEFDGDLSTWTILNEAEATVQVTAGQLQLQPAANSLWYNDSTGVLVYKAVSGNFIATSSLSIRSALIPANIPPAINFGGLMALDPTSSGANQNYVHIAYGNLNMAAEVETKTTVDGTSVFPTNPWPGVEGEIRICRLANRFLFYTRVSGGMWQFLREYDRPDFPTTLNVGLMAYANDNADSITSFDFIHFASPNDEADCSI